MEKNFITFEQASKIGQLKPIADEYNNSLQLIVRYFAKNTLAQFTNFEIFGRAIELGSYYNKGDYSKFLFDETEKLIKDFEELKTNIDILTPKMIELARNYSASIIKENKTNETK